MRIDKLIEESRTLRGLNEALIDMDENPTKKRKHIDDIFVHTYVVPGFWRKNRNTRLHRKHLRLLNRRRA